MTDNHFVDKRVDGGAKTISTSDGAGATSITLINSE